MDAIDGTSWLGPERQAFAAGLSRVLRPLPLSAPRLQHGLKAAAVMVPLLVGPSGNPFEIIAGSMVPVAFPVTDLLFLVRPDAMTTHAGQVAFPGGRVDPEDASVTAAALREAEEELGIPRNLAVPVGALDPVPSPTGYLITPIVALVPRSLTLVPSPDEVASHFAVPLPDLAHPARRRTMHGRRGAHGGNANVAIHFWVDTPAVIWGVTGHILDRFLDRLGQLR